MIRGLINYTQQVLTLSHGDVAGTAIQPSNIATEPGVDDSQCR